MKSAGTGVAGVLFWLVAIYFFVSGAGMPTTVPNPYPMDGMGEVANLQLLQIQLLNWMTAIGAALVGTIFLCTSAIIAVLDREHETQ
jgi:hypothetical protein